MVSIQICQTWLLRQAAVTPFPHIPFASMELPMLKTLQASLELQGRDLWRLVRHLGTRILVHLYIRVEEGTNAAIEDQDEDATIEIVSNNVVQRFVEKYV